MWRVLTAGEDHGEAGEEGGGKEEDTEGFLFEVLK